ncbi:MAG: hypothetical protein H0T75_15165 [Rhizobiales bacterium]|nr:hypothetical protein [Hyphomicrobiales bacterium]
MTLDKRLDRLTLVYRRRELSPASGTAFDSMRLSFAEQIELDDLLRPLAPLPGEGWGAALESLSTEELERAVELTRKASGEGPSAPYRYMSHRPPTVGECLCAECLAAAAASAGDGGGEGPA